MATKRDLAKMDLTKEEKRVSKKICQQHKFTRYRASDLQIENLKTFTFGIGVINMLIVNGRYDELLIILALLSVNELVNVAAAAHADFVDLFWAPRNSKLTKDFCQHFFLKSFFHNKPNPDHLATLTTGSQILREYRLYF